MSLSWWILCSGGVWYAHGPLRSVCKQSCSCPPTIPFSRSSFCWSCLCNTCIILYFLHDLWKRFCSIKLIWKELVVLFPQLCHFSWYRTIFIAETFSINFHMIRLFVLFPKLPKAVCHWAVVKHLGNALTPFMRVRRLLLTALKQ